MFLNKYVFSKKNRPLTYNAICGSFRPGRTRTGQSHKDTKAQRDTEKLREPSRLCAFVAL
ncbi:Uncharacterized protein dnm_002030 [Desulfonema magnum]|uniref:Uncharacterized protein n=1 Tax=Desulfonema magnum TaxID=45655 RepID=A0A975GJZ8_9BACT|nr:Uncharacterized protein dnm_002030 [Desulfonema magnum]